MNEQSLVDLSLNLNGQAWAVLHLLNGYGVQLGDSESLLYDAEKEQYLFNSTTYAFYNGRERGFALVVEHPSQSAVGGSLVIAFAENRSSDDIVVYSWESRWGLYDPPTVKDMPEDARQKAEFHKTVNDAVWAIWRKVEVYLVEKHEALKDTENSRSAKLQERAV